ncbi:MAG TPA: glycosyl hydrolase [Gaiellaceae bacterium]|jgi:hypothetical protein|nr:glycosyl hydrolase [Gaiellaceae bacterium]
MPRLRPHRPARASRRIALRLVVVLALAALAAGVASARPASGGSNRSTLASVLGVYVGAGNRDGVDAFSAWLGSSVGYAEDYLPFGTWPSAAARAWILKRWQDSGLTLVLGVPLVPSSGGSLAAGAAGAYDPWFASLARQLADAGEGNAILRLGWEFNGSWYPWGVRSNDDARTFAAYFRRVVTTMRAIAPGLRFDWNPSAGVWPAFDIAQAYPGDAYVDDIGLDVYDQSWIAEYGSPQARWNDFLRQTVGLAWQRSFARAHGKPVSFPEWGVTVRPDGHGGGDDPFYVEQMASWIASSDTGYAVYFDYNASDGAHALDDARFARSAATFRRLFGA